MPWVRLQENALDHPKMLGLVDPRRPFDLWIWGLAYTQKHLTDGFLPAAAIPRGSEKAAGMLTARGLWESAEAGFQIHDYAQWNDLRDTVMAKRLGARQRARKSRTSHEHRAPHGAVGVVGVVGSSNDLSTTKISLPTESASMRGKSGAPLAIGLRRLKVWRWMLDSWITTLGPHADAFDLEAWLHQLDQRDTAVVLNHWEFLDGEFQAEVRRRHLPIAVAPAMHAGKQTTRLAAALDSIRRAEGV